MGPALTGACLEARPCCRLWPSPVCSGCGGHSEIKGHVDKGRLSFLWKAADSIQTIVIRFALDMIAVLKNEGGAEPGGQGSTPALIQAGKKQWEVGVGSRRLEGQVRARGTVGDRTEGLWVTTWGDRVVCHLN